LHQALIRDQTGNDNHWSLLIVQQSIMTVITHAVEESEQIEAIHNRLQAWLDCLFANASIEESLTSLKQVKSAIEPEAEAAPEP
jgi:hypothetical protein